ncbi:MAG: nickel-dependent hydrogenase large subunit [Methylophaga sp.]|nr:nickel-dependent hydrogenase large subunit [Methylophaga sp.]
MSIQGELTISLSHQGATLHSEITSSRPLHAPQLFSGKPIDQVLKTIPLLFNICAKAQAVTAVRAIESALSSPVNDHVESQREALVAIESLREQSLQVMMDWPSRIGEPLNTEMLSDIVQSLNKLMHTFEPKQLLSHGANIEAPISLEQSALWEHCATQLSVVIFGEEISCWQQGEQAEIEHWATQKQTQAARFIAWLMAQDWKYAGHSKIALLPEISDYELMTKISTEQQRFIAQPDWQSSCYEASWFNHQSEHSVIKKLTKEKGNGIYTRMLARLTEIADLMTKLNNFFILKKRLAPPVCKVKGLANTDAARGRLTHYVSLDGDCIDTFYILAPTEWNFHPRGVAANSLNNLSYNDLNTLKIQADLLIHAIDPCVGYQLQINHGVVH